MLKPAAKACGCHYRALQRASGDLTADVEEHAAHLCAQWGCGVEVSERPPSHDAIAARVTMLLDLPAAPAGCPFAPLYRHAPPLVLRATRGLARMEQGLVEASAFPGGVTAVDVAALDVLRRAQNARSASDDAAREKERKQRETAQIAAAK